MTALTASPSPATASPRLDRRADVVKPLPNQPKLLDAMYTKEYILYGGAGGGGKSYGLRWAGVELLLYWAQTLSLRGVKVGLFCEDYPSLKDRHISKFAEFPVWLGEVRDTQQDGLCYFLRDCYGGGKVALRNLDDPAKYRSTEFAAVLVDELTRNHRQTFDDLRFRKRWPSIAHSPFIAATNPGGIGHAWVKKLWIDRDFSGDDALLDPSSFAFIPSYAKENAHLPPSYWATLHSLPLMMRRALEEGSWDLFEGQYFSEWSRAQNVCAPYVIPLSWKRLISLDYGFTKPSAVGWWAVSGEGEWTLYREHYVTGRTYKQLVDEILELTPLLEPIDRAIADPAIWADRPRHDETVGQSGGEVMAEQFSRRDISLVRGNHERIQGWQRCRELIQPLRLPDGKIGSKLQVFNTCPHFIRTISGLVHDAVRVEDLDTNGEDHHADEWRYAVNTQAEFGRIEAELDELFDDEGTLTVNRGYGFGR